MNAVNVEKLTVGSHLLLNIREHILEKSPMSALTVGRPSVIDEPLQTMRGYMLGNPMNGDIVERPLASGANLLGIRETILERPYECNECGKAFSYNTSFLQHETTYREETL